MSSPSTQNQQLATVGRVTRARVGAMGRVRAVQLNCNGRKEIASALALWMLEKKVEIALLQEQYSTSATGMAAGFPAGMRVFGKPGTKSAIVLNSATIEAMLMDDLTTQHGVCVWTKGKYGELIVCSVYCQFRSRLEPYVEYMHRVVEAAGATPLLMAMDANCRSRLWHSKTRIGVRGNPLPCGPKARPLEEMLLGNDMLVLNEPSCHFTYSGPAGQSDIDVSVGNSALARWEHRWRVCPGELTSDHNAIMIEFIPDHESVQGVPTVVRWNTRGADWCVFRRLIAEAAGRVDVLNTSAEELCAVVDGIVTAACEACFRPGQTSRARKQQWWTAELATHRRSVRRAREAYQWSRRRLDGPAMTDETTELRRQYRVLERAYGARIQKAKAEDWRRFVATSGNNDPWGTVYRICRDGAPRAVGSLRTADGPTRSWSQTAEVLLKAFHPGRYEHEEVPAATVDLQPDPITEDEVAEAIATTRRRRAPGLDGKRSDVVKNVFRAAPALLTALYDKCLQEGCFPCEWKKGQVLAFLKSPSRDRMEPGSYRPITLLPVIAKVLEKVVVRRLHRIVEPSPTQFGFTAGRSTVDAWQMAKELVRTSGAKYVLGVFVDFRGAFDHLSWGSILRKLQDCGCREMGLWRSYFRDRKSCLVGRQDTVWHDVVRGCPQGSICGPAMWNLLMGDLLQTLTRHEIRHVAYADDLLLIVEGRNRAMLEGAAVSALQHAVAWGAVVGVDVSPTKTEAMMLRGRFDVERMPIVRVGGGRVNVKSAVRYLGVWATMGLRFERHLRETADKLKTVIAPLRRVLRRDWGMKRKACMAWTNGLLKPIALYAAPVWFETVRSAHGRQLMMSSQRLGLLACIRACRTVSTLALQVLAGCLPWDLEALRLVGRYKHRHNLAMGPADVLTPDEAAAATALETLDLRVAEEWQRRWTLSELGRVTHAYIPHTGQVCMQFDPSTKALFLLTGHGSMNAYLQERTARESSLCSCGAAFEDCWHILRECPQFDDLRDLQRMGVTIAGGRLDVSNVLRSEETCTAFVSFAEAVFRRRARQENERAAADQERRRQM